MGRRRRRRSGGREEKNDFFLSLSLSLCVSLARVLSLSLCRDLFLRSSCTRRARFDAARSEFSTVLVSGQKVEFFCRERFFCRGSFFLSFFLPQTRERAERAEQSQLLCFVGMKKKKRIAQKVNFYDHESRFFAPFPRSFLPLLDRITRDSSNAARRKTTQRALQRKKKATMEERKKNSSEKNLHLFSPAALP